MDQLIFDESKILNCYMFYWDISNKYRIYCLIKENGSSVRFNIINYNKSDSIDFWLYEANLGSDCDSPYSDSFNEPTTKTLGKFGLVSNVNRNFSKKEFERVFNLIYNFVESSTVEDVKILSLNKEVKKQEKPCRNCKKMNDIGVSSCWWCEIKVPTG